MPVIRPSFSQRPPAAQGARRGAGAAAPSRPTAIRHSSTALLLLALLAGCSYDLSATRVPGVDLSAYRDFYVRQQPRDERSIAGLIAAQLDSRGLRASSGVGPAPAAAQVLVVYEDVWAWDFTGGSYLMTLRLDLRDPATNVLLASATSYRSSLARKGPKETVAEVVEAVFRAP